MTKVGVAKGGENVTAGDGGFPCRQKKRARQKAGPFVR